MLLPQACLLLTVLCVLAGVAVGYNYTIKRFSVPVDHFSFTNNDTFEIRYLINKDHWTGNGPIFFYTGNEGAIELFAENTGFVWEIAPEFHAMIVFAEHRYYGESMPYGNKSFSDLKYLGYLTSEQALADYVDLIQFLHDSLPPKSRNPVIAFGGSYGGMLAAWLRIKYPHMVVGAIAASAPIFQFTGLTPCDAFNRIITSDFKETSEECYLSIKKSWNVINNYTSSNKLRQWLHKHWMLCSPLEEGHGIYLKYWLRDVYTNMAMLNYPYPTNFLTPLPAFPIREACKHLSISSVNDTQLLESLFNSVSVYFNYTGEAKCLNLNQTATPSLGNEGWDFQACSEMVMPICSDGYYDMFEKEPWNFNEYAEVCYSQWKVHSQENLIKRLYGGKDISSASNIVFSNGLLDPWSSGGVMKNLSPSLIAVIIPEGAHHLDLRASNAADPYSVKQARKIHRKQIKTWIEQYRKHQKNFQIQTGSTYHG